MEYPESVKDIKNLNKFIREARSIETDKYWSNILYDCSSANYSDWTRKESRLKWKREMIQKYLDYKNNKLEELNKLEEKASIDWNNYLTREEVKKFLSKDNKVASAEEIIYHKDGPWFQKYWCDFQDGWTKQELVQDLANFYYNGHLITESNSNKLILYHNTTNENAIKISKEGIISGKQLNVYGKDSEAEGSGIWCSIERGYGYGGATITFQIDENDESLTKQNNTEYIVYKDIKPEEIIDIDLVVTTVNTEGHRITESDIPKLINKYGKKKLLDVLRSRPNSFVKPYKDKNMIHLIETGEKYCKGKIKVEESINKSNIQGFENYSENEIKQIVNDYIYQTLLESDIIYDRDDFIIKDIQIYGSRNRGTAKQKSDLDVVVEYEGDFREDDLFNTLNYPNEELEINGIRVDINPITYTKSGNIDEFMLKSDQYDNKIKDKQKFEESENGIIVGYRSIGLNELKLLLNGETISGKFIGSNEDYTDIKYSNKVYFYKDPVMWRDKEHQVMIECQFDKKDIIEGTGEYSSNLDLTNKGIWNGKQGSRWYYLDEFVVDKYNSDNIISFINPKEVLEVIENNFPELKEVYINLNKNGSDLKDIHKHIQPSKTRYYFLQWHEMNDWVIGQDLLSSNMVEALKNKMIILEPEENYAIVRAKADEYNEKGIRPEDVKDKIITYDQYHDFLRNLNKKESKQKIEEASRNELLYQAKRQTISRYNRADGYKGFYIYDIDASGLFTKESTLLVVCKVGQYHTQLELQDMLYWVQITAEENREKQINTKNVTKALMNAIDGMDIKVNCECGDWTYRFAYMATQLGFKYGKPENRPAKIRNPHDYGAICKHLIAELSNKKWLQQVTSTLMDYIEKNIDKVNEYLRLEGDKQLTLPNELARQMAKQATYSKLMNRQDLLKQIAEEFIADENYDNYLDDDLIRFINDNYKSKKITQQELKIIRNYINKNIPEQDKEGE